MSEDMKQRLVVHGFPEERIRVHPVSIDVKGYRFHTRRLADGQPLQVVGVGRLVEKKGFDDLLRAMAIVKERSSRPVSCALVGGGPLEEELRRLPPLSWGWRKPSSSGVSWRSGRDRPCSTTRTSSCSRRRPPRTATWSSW